MKKTNLEGMLEVCAKVASLRMDEEMFGDYDEIYSALRKFENASIELKNKGFDVSDLYEGVILETCGMMQRVMGNSIDGVYPDLREEAKTIPELRLDIGPDSINMVLYIKESTEKLVDLIRRNADISEFSDCKREYNQYFVEPNMIMNEYHINRVMQYFQNEFNNLCDNNSGVISGACFGKKEGSISMGNQENQRFLNIGFEGYSKTITPDYEHNDNDVDIINHFVNNNFNISDYLYRRNNSGMVLSLSSLDENIDGGDLINYRLKEGESPTLKGISHAAKSLNPNEPYKVIDKIIDMYLN